MLTTAVFEHVQQFYHATEIGNVASAVSACVRWFLVADDNLDSHQNLIITFWPIYNFS